jgi:pyruvate kinase
VTSLREMTDRACQVAKREGVAEPGQSIVITVGLPFGTPGATNALRIAWVE